MAVYRINEQTLTEMADAIRQATGQTGPISFTEIKTTAEEHITEGVILPELTNEGMASDLLLGTELIDSDGNIVEGTIPTFDGSYECSGESTGGNVSLETFTGTIYYAQLGGVAPKAYYTNGNLNFQTLELPYSFGSWGEKATITVCANTIVFVDSGSSITGNGFEIIDSTTILPTSNEFEIRVE